MSGCPPRHRLAALLRDELETDDRTGVERHVSACADCQRVIKSLRGTGQINNMETSADEPLEIDETLEVSPSTMQAAAEESARATRNLEVPGYVLIDELGRGAMGVVYKARQLSLDRLVALKMIRSAAIAGEAQLARFKTEAESLAQLQHNNIVQVFEIGEHDEMPYLAMEFVAGESLDAAIVNRRFGIKDSPALVEKLARAMFSTHQRGVLHRDLKPSNVLLAEEGEPKITDFGLAKRISSDSQLTADHTVMGTPSYMPPEQAHGKIAEIGPRSDVYSLGAILYELLTGRPPFRGATPLETIQQVIHREPASPRSLNAKVPRDLETICLKCLHKQPERRYETAADLADDLRRFDRGEPILARRIGPVGRGWRWCRRHPELSASAAVVCLLLFAGAAGGLWWSQKAERARQQAEQQFEARFQLIEDLMERVPEGERAQDDRLQAALSSYESWLAEQPSDQAQASYADALFRTAEIRRRIGQFELASEMYGKARDRYQQLADLAPTNGTFLHKVAETMNWLGECYRESGEPQQAIAAYEEAMQYQEVLAERETENAQYRADIARSLYNRALARRGLEQIEEAESDLNRSIELLQQCAEERPTEAGFQQGLARSRINLGILHRARGNLNEANKQYLLAIERLEQLESQHPQNAEYRFELATVLMNRANLLLDEHRLQELGLSNALKRAQQSYQSAVDKLKALATEYGNVPRYRKELANSLNGLGAVLLQAGDRDAAERKWISAREEGKALIDRSPGVAEYHRLIALTSRNLAYLHRNHKDSSVLRRFLEEAVDYQRRATELSSQNVLYAETLRSYQRTLARFFVDAGEHAAAAELAEQLIQDGGDDVKTSYAAAMTLARCANQAEQDESLDLEIRQSLAESHRRRASTILESVRQQGLTVRPADFPGLGLDRADR